MQFKYQCHKECLLSDFLLECGYSNKMLVDIKKRQLVSVNGVYIRLWEKVYINDEVVVNLDEEDDGILEEGFLEIVYEDDYILIINKPHNIACIPTFKHYEHNLSNYIRSYYQKNNIKSKIHFVNRIDYATMGLVMVAKNAFVHHLFSNVSITKKYYAVVQGVINQEMIIEKPILKQENSMLRIIDERGQYAKTTIFPLQSDGKKTLLNVLLHTGRTHQIRVHLASLNLPIVGDSLYGNKKDFLQLQSYYLSFKHPILKKEIEINYPLSLDFSHKLT